MNDKFEPGDLVCIEEHFDNGAFRLINGGDRVRLRSESLGIVVFVANQRYQDPCNNVNVYDVAVLFQDQVFSMTQGIIRKFA